MSGTQRRLDNIPKELDRLTKLADLDLSYNQLVGVPEPVFDLRALRKLDLSHNEISELSALTDNWPSLEYLNLSHNQLVSIPSGLTRLTKLRKLYLNDNQLTFSGLPSGMAKLNDLEVLNASNNKLENIPEGVLFSSWRNFLKSFLPVVKHKQIFDLKCRALKSLWLIATAVHSPMVAFLPFVNHFQIRGLINSFGWEGIMRNVFTSPYLGAVVIQQAVLSAAFDLWGMKWDSIICIFEAFWSQCTPNMRIEVSLNRPTCLA